MSLGGEARWLLIGNSRWHWAADHHGQRRYWSAAPAASIAVRPDRWAAVGPVPEGLDLQRRVQLAQVPLVAAPPWLGIDRALAGYQAWCLSGAAVLVADAGTALSLTWIDAQGRFAGGRLMAGAALQLRALHGGTQALPAVVQAETGLQHDWPHATGAAMACGVLEGLAGALQRAAWQVRQRDPAVQLWLTGGDGGALSTLMAQPGHAQGWTLSSGLCLDGLVRVAELS